MTDHFFYLRHTNGHPIGVLALRRKGDDAVTIAASLCSPADEWSRTAGVNKACGKLNSSRYAMEINFVTWVDGAPDIRPDLAIDLLADLFGAVEHEGFPSGDVLGTLSIIDYERAQKMLAQQITYLLVPKPERRVGGG